MYLLDDHVCWSLFHSGRIYIRCLAATTWYIAADMQAISIWTTIQECLILPIGTAIPICASPETLPRTIWNSASESAKAKAASGSRQTLLPIKGVQNSQTSYNEEAPPNTKQSLYQFKGTSNVK